MIYRYALPKALAKCQVIRFRGHIAYPESDVGIPNSGIHGNIVDNLAALI